MKPYSVSPWCSHDSLSLSEIVLSKSVVVGVDYGTTFTSVSYHVTSNLDPGAELLIRPSDIKAIRNWPHDALGTAEQVPTVSWYSPALMKRAEPVEQYDAPKDAPRRRSIYEDDEQQQDKDSLAPNQVVIGTVAGVDEDDGDYLYAWEVGHERYVRNRTREESLLIQHAKLGLLTTSFTDRDRKDLRRQVTAMVKRGIIRKYGKRNEPDPRDLRDIIADFLTKVLEHTKQQLAIHEEFTEGCSVEFVVTVPTIWSPEASRILQFSVAAAIQATRFGTVCDGSIDNLFLVTEPEAGLTWLLQNTAALVVCIPKTPDQG